WAAGKAFYADVMGWDSKDEPIGDGVFYTMYSQDGCNVGAINPLQPELMEKGHPSYWSCYVTVDDVDAMAEKVTDLGGRLIAGPFDVFDDGRMITLQDPTGAVLCLWQPKNTIGAGMVNAPGAMLWNELITNDPEKAMDFYGKLLGWTFMKDEKQDAYWMAVNNGRMNGGIMKMDEAMGEMQSAWMVYYNTSDLDAALEKVKKHGGKIHIEAVADGMGKFAMIGDPAGAMFYLMQTDQYEEWKE
ncbi:MAG: VOC family protein, partial [Aggregatilineales bacterium]